MLEGWTVQFGFRRQCCDIESDVGIAWGNGMFDTPMGYIL